MGMIRDTPEKIPVNRRLVGDDGGRGIIYTSTFDCWPGMQVYCSHKYTRLRLSLNSFPHGVTPKARQTSALPKMHAIYTLPQSGSGRPSFAGRHRLVPRTPKQTAISKPRASFEKHQKGRRGPRDLSRRACGNSNSFNKQAEAQEDILDRYFVQLAL